MKGVEMRASRYFTIILVICFGLTTVVASPYQRKQRRTKARAADLAREEAYAEAEYQVAIQDEVALLREQNYSLEQRALIQNQISQLGYASDIYAQSGDIRQVSDFLFTDKNYHNLQLTLDLLPEGNLRTTIQNWYALFVNAKASKRGGNVRRVVNETKINRRWAFDILKGLGW
jgi:hypothetical protein